MEMIYPPRNPNLLNAECKKCSAGWQFHSDEIRYITYRIDPYVITCGYCKNEIKLVTLPNNIKDLVRRRS